jgi:hypothetical protein
MKHFEEVKTLEVTSITCDVCNGECKKEFSIESANIKASWGYESDHDLDHYDFDLCEVCFLKAVSYLKTIAVNPEKLNPKEFSLDG